MEQVPARTTRTDTERGMRRRRSGLHVAAIAVGLALFAAACGDDGAGPETSSATGSGTGSGTATTTTGAPQVGGTLTFASYSEIFGLDPLVALGSGTSGGTEMTTIYDTIMRYEPDTRKYVPVTAESVTASTDSTEWTIKLKPNIKFTDGTDYDAEAVIFNINRHRVGNGIEVAKCATYIACPRNSRATSGQALLIKDLTAVDKTTVKVTLTEPWTSFQYALATEMGLVASPTALKKCDGTKNPNLCDFNTKPVGAGPFMIESFKTGEGIVVVRNPNYYGGQVYLDSIKFVSFGDTGGVKTYDAFKTGTVSGAYLRVPDVVAQARADGAKGLSAIDQAGEVLIMNMGATVTCAAGKPEPLCTGKPDGPTPTNPATKSLKVRQAVAAAFDPKAFNERVYQGKGLAGTELFQKSFPWNPGVPGPTYDLAKAKQLVTEAKAEGWDGTIKVVFTNSPSGQASGVTIETMLRAAGMNPVLDTSKDSTGQQAVVTTSKDFDVSTWGMPVGPDDSAIFAMIQNLQSTASSNRSGFKSARADEALKKLLSAPDDATKTAQYKIIAEEVNALLPVVPRVAIETFRVFDPKVRGVVSNAKQMSNFSKAWIAK
jgi:peptide/nickel transport system substrate-binding protein